MPELPSERATAVVIDRGHSYGHPMPVFRVAAGLWSAYLGCAVDPEDVPILMALHKMARERNRHHDDNITDICGYMNTYEMMAWTEDEQPNRRQ